jgi:hypothetical protein
MGIQSKMSDYDEELELTTPARMKGGKRSSAHSTIIGLSGARLFFLLLTMGAAIATLGIVVAIFINQANHDVQQQRIIQSILDVLLRPRAPT